MKWFLRLIAAAATVAVAAGANYTVNANLVKAGAGSAQAFTAAESIQAGQAIYKPTASTVALATCTNSTKAACAGIAVNTAYTGQPVSIVGTDARFQPGITNLTAGAILVLSATPGGIAPSGDLASGQYPIILGVATSTTNMMLDIMKGTAAIP